MGETAAGTQEALIAEAVRNSARVFSEHENYTKPYDPDSNKRNFYFPGISYFKSGTITPDMIAQLQSGGNMLSVGSGDAHLERLLSDGFDIGKERITLSDLDLDPKVRDLGFQTYEFDMLQPWPDLQRQFNYVLFPESLSVATMNIEGDQRSYRFFDDLDRDSERIMRGEMPIRPDLFKCLVEEDVPKSESLHNIMSEAVSLLKPGGEVRVRYGIDEPQQRAYVMLRLAEDVPGITFPSPSDGPNFTVKVPGNT